MLISNQMIESKCTISPFGQSRFRERSIVDQLMAKAKRKQMPALRASHQETQGNDLV
jgi:hypothetical protein